MTRMRCVFQVALSLMALAQGAQAAPVAEDALLRQATVKQAQANAIALARLPRSVVKSAELEREHGRLVWSLDLAEPARPGVTEIQIDATNGKIVSIKKETAAQEAREVRAEHGAAK